MAPRLPIWSLIPRYIVLLLVCSISHHHGFTIEDSERLLANLTSGYNTLFRPRYNQTDVVEVNVTFDLASIHDFDEVNEKITITAILYVAWHDEFYTWNPADFGGQTYITVDSARIWLPNLVHTNSVDKITKLTEDWHLLTAQHDGRVNYLVGGIFIASCSVDVTYYPWDRQWCPIYIYSWGHKSSAVNMFPGRNKVLKSYYSENGIWTVSDSKVYPEHESGGDTVTLQLVLDRKPDFVVVNVIVPIVFMSFLNVLIFLIPMECGEKISYSITMLLAIAVFLTLIGEYLPKTSKPLSNYSIYLLVVLSISVCITLATLASMMIYYRENKQPVGAFWKWLAALAQCKCRKPCPNPTPSELRHPQISPSRDRSRLKDSLSSVRTESTDGTSAKVDVALYKHWMNDQQTEESRGERSKEDITWQHVSKAMDTLCLVLFFTVTVLITVGFLYNLSNGQPKERP